MAATSQAARYDRSLHRILDKLLGYGRPLHFVYAFIIAPHLFSDFALEETKIEAFLPEVVAERFQFLRIG